MRRVIVIALIVVFASSALALATWKVVDLVQGEDGSPPALEASSAAEGIASEPGEAPGEGEAEDGVTAAEVEAADIPSGESTAYTDPDQRYVSETQRHQNFFVALAEGEIKRLDNVATDYQPAGDPNTSYMYFTVTKTDGSTSDGTMVLKFEGGMWRIAAIRQLTGNLGGGTNYVVPADFEADLAREITELQEFLSKVAQGRLDYLIVDNVNRVSDTMTILTGRTVGLSGRIDNAEMTLCKDYNIWHLVDVECLGTL